MHIKFIPGKFFLAITTATLAIVLLTKASPVEATAGAWSANGSIIYYNDGNVGLGTNDPKAKLQLGNLSTVNETTSGSGYTWTALGSNLYLTSTAWQRVNTSKGGAIIYMSGEPADNNINFQITDNSGNNYRMATFGKDNVLLQNSDLWIDKGSGASAIIGANGNIVFRMDRNGGGSGNHISFQDYTGGYLMSVKDNGNVGIGTGNPQRKLSVNGTVLAKEVIVSTSASYWPDYVFESGYNLLPIPQLKSYIQTNKHLPGIASANEIAESGLSLGDMQQKQMEKIEELTLYIIQQQEQIDTLKTELATIKNQIN